MMIAILDAIIIHSVNLLKYLGAHITCHSFIWKTTAKQHSPQLKTLQALATFSL
jgi:hypothetical protein